MRRHRGGGLSDILPVTTWGQWAQLPGALAWSANTQAPAPLANGGLYTGAQSTGAWASHPMPATQYGFAVEAAKTAHTPEVFYHQRPNDNSGASYSPIVGSQAGPQLTSMTQGPRLTGGKRSTTRKRSTTLKRSTTHRRRRNRKSRKVNRRNK